MAPGAWFVRHITYPILFPLLRGVRGRDALEMYAHYLESERWPIERHREVQWSAIQRLLAHAHENCPFHRARMISIGAEPGDFKSLEDYARLPVLTREDVQRNLPDLISRTAKRGAWELNSTSGSTGTPLSFGVDHQRYMRVRAVLHRNQGWMGLRLGERHALLWAAFAETRTAKSRLHRFAHWAMNQQLHSAWELGDEDLRSVNDQMRRWGAKVLTSFSSTLVTYARAIERLRLQTPRFLGIISTGETLFPQQRDLIEAAFGCRVFNRYGDMELGDIAHECEAHDGMHLNEERIYTEIVPDPTLRDGTGDVVCTDLDNWSMPFLRYRTGDMARWHERPSDCACGRPLRRFAEVQGRRYDIVVDRDGTPINGLVLEDIGSGAEGVASFQCVQRAPDRLLFRVIPLPGFDRDTIHHNLLERSRRSIGPERFQLDLELVDEIAPTKSGKLRQIVVEMDG